MSNEAGEAAPPIAWAYHNPSNTNANPQTCSLAFPSRDALREHVLAQHVHAEPPVPVECLEVWQSAGGLWRGKVKVDALKSFRRSLKSDPGASCHAVPYQQVLRNREPLDNSDLREDDPNTLAAHGIPQSQEISVVSQVFSPYITSSDEQPPLQQVTQDAPPINNNSSSSSTNPTHAQPYTPVPNPSPTHSRSHIRNASDESASLPQSNDYETVPGIVPPLLRESPLPAPLPHTASPAHQATAHTSPGDQPFLPQAYTSPPPPPPPSSHPLAPAPAGTAKATTPLHIGIAFGALPSVSSSVSSSGNAASASSGNTNPFTSTSNPPAAAAAASNDHSEMEPGMRTSTAAAAGAAGADSPTSGGRKHVDRPLRFGFGGK
ncbi:hypothetical protein QFC21_001164 [Naganishia friedmannii]|uniref:Uncharacterized protein n=1 Tax=Naganishia friedmannii TaxID=89922 RepID=A0ACC2W914_9TREE|nr:hypothetical protein QFC21_001164 [Naganishia friedmannii]